MSAESAAAIPSLATDSMRPGRTLVNGARTVYVISWIWIIKILIAYGVSSASTSRPRIPPRSQKTWQPNHGIVFHATPRPGIARMTSAAAVNVEQDMMLHSNAEDSYVLASSDMSAVEAAIAQDAKEADKPARIQIPEPPEIPADPRWDVLPEQNGQEWKMTEELFQAAKDADTGTPESYWSHSLYRGPAEEGKEPKKVTVHYCRSKDTTDRVLKRYFADSKVIGFDIEWLINAGSNAGPKQKVSLIQVANEERVALFHLALYPGNKKEDLVSPALRQLMESPDITKVGVAIKGDCTRLRNNLDIDSQSLFELSHLFKLVKYSESKEHKLINKKLTSLATQVQEHLHLPMFKGGEVRSSDWSRALNLEQIRYAASDSYAGIQLFTIMEAKREKLDPCPPRPYHAEKNIPIRTAQGATLTTEDTGEAEAELNGEEAKPEEPETPAPIKRKYKKKATPYLPTDSSSSLDFEDLELKTALEQNAATITRKRTPRQKITRTISQQDAADEPEDIIPNETLLQNAETEALSHLFTSTSTSSSPEGKQQPSLTSLRTYFLWSRNPQLSLSDIARIIQGDAPLSVQAVARRVLEVASWLSDENEELESERIRGVLNDWKHMGFDGTVWEVLEGRVGERERERLSQREWVDDDGVGSSEDSDDGGFESMEEKESVSRGKRS